MIVPLFDPGKGVFTAGDQDDLPPGFASELENFYPDRPGKIRKRDGVLNYGSGFPASSYLRNLFRFVHKDLTGGAAWLSLWQYLASDIKLTVTDETDANLAAFYAETGELYIAKGSAIEVGDTFEVGGTGDLTDNALATAKGSAVAANDVFNVTNIGEGTEAVEYLGAQSGKIYVSNAAGTSWTLVEDIGITATGDEMRALVIGVVLRLAFSRSISPVWYGYIKRKFFHDLWDHSYTTPVWYDCDAAVKYPATWSHNYISRQSSAGGELGTGHYFYKVVPVFDGGQEALFPDGKLYYYTSGTANILMLKMMFNTNDWNPRITHLKIYRQINPDAKNDEDALYQLIDVVSTQNDPAVVTGTGATMEKKWYDKGKSWTTHEWAPTGVWGAENENDLKYVLVYAAVNEYDIDDNSASFLSLHEDGPALAIGGASYEIKKYKYVSGEWVYQSTEDTGTDGWGGQESIYVSAASYEDNEFLKYLIKEQSAYRMILANNDKVLCLDGNPTNGTAVALRIGRWIWDYSSPNVTLRFLDAGLLDKGYHPLAGVTSIEAYYKYSTWFRGRLYVLNLAFDPSGENEQYPDWVGFSEIDQPDVIPNKNFIMPDSGRGGEGMGIFPLDSAGTLAVFYRHDIAYLQAPRPDPMAWEKYEHEGDIGLINDAAIVRTPIGYFFCYDTGVYFMGLDGRIKERAVSFPIDDTYRAAVVAGSTDFSVMYLSERRIVLFNLGTDTEAWALEIDSVYGEYPKWFKFPYGTVSDVQVKPERSALDENGYFYLHEREGTKISRMHEALTGTEVFGTKLKTAYIHPGTMEREPIIRYARLNHKGSDNVTPKVYLNDGEDSETLTVIPASANGEEKVIKIKRRGRNVALELVSAASANVDHEIRGIELEVGV